MRTKNNTIMLRLSTEDKEKIRDAAQKAGMTMSTFLLLLFRNFSDGIRFERKNNRG